MQKYSKLSLILFSITCLIVLPYIVLSIYIIDPLQIWHKSFFDTNTSSYTIRESAKAFIRDNEFDSVILGNSHSENTSAKKASEILGGKFLNLSMSGSSLDEKYILLKYLLKRKNIKQVVFLMDTQYQYLNRIKNTSSFDFLYDDNPYNDIKIYLNNKYFLCALGWQKKSKCKIRHNLNIDCPYYWEDKELYMKRFGGFNNWLIHKNDKQISRNFNTLLRTPLSLNNDKIDEEYSEKLGKYLNKYLLNIINDNPNIKFYIIISPISDLALAHSIRDNNLLYAKKMLLLKYLTEFQSEHKNIEIYAFDNISTTSKIEDYKDLEHYKSWINYYILNSIAQKKHGITIYNREEYAQEVYSKAKNIDYNYYINEIKNVLNKT